MATKIRGVLIREGVLVPSHWAVVRVGACRAALPAFVTDGHFAIGHDWCSLGVGTIESAQMNERNEVIFVAELYDGVPAADELAEVIRQRAEKGKSNSLSAGFFCSGLAFWSGAELLGWLAEQGDDLNQYDTAPIAAWTDQIFLITEIDPIVECSSVLDGAVDEATVLEVFSGESENSARLRLNGTLDEFRALTQHMEATQR